MSVPTALKPDFSQRENNCYLMRFPQFFFGSVQVPTEIQIPAAGVHNCQQPPNKKRRVSYVVTHEHNAVAPHQGLPFNSYSYADPYDITKRDCGVTVDLPHKLNVEASSVGVAVNDTGVTEPADDVVASCSSGRGVTSWACDDLDDTDRSSDCDSETSTWEDRTSDSDYDVGLSEDCESESEIDDFGSPETDNEEELLRAANPTKTEMEKNSTYCGYSKKSLGLIKPKTRYKKGHRN
jgi:hypothetical protein